MVAFFLGILIMVALTKYSMPMPYIIPNRRWWCWVRCHHGSGVFSARACRCAGGELVMGRSMPPCDCGARRLIIRKYYDMVGKWAGQWACRPAVSLRARARALVSGARVWRLASPRVLIWNGQMFSLG
jgi:hypothetical protein